LGGCATEAAQEKEEEEHYRGETPRDLKQRSTSIKLRERQHRSTKLLTFTGNPTSRAKASARERSKNARKEITQKRDTQRKKRKREIAEVSERCASFLDGFARRRFRWVRGLGGKVNERMRRDLGSGVKSIRGWMIVQGSDAMSRSKMRERVRRGGTGLLGEGMGRSLTMSLGGFYFFGSEQAHIIKNAGEGGYQGRKHNEEKSSQSKRRRRNSQPTAPLCASLIYNRITTGETPSKKNF